MSLKQYSSSGFFGKVVYTLNRRKTSHTEPGLSLKKNKLQPIARNKMVDTGIDPCNRRLAKLAD